MPPAPVVARQEVGYAYKNAGNGTSWVLLHGDDDATMNGSMADLQAARRYRTSPKEEVLWFRQGGREYLVRHAALLEQARELFKSETKLRAQQEELGRRQAELGSRQNALGARLGALGAELSAVAAERTRRGGGDAVDLDRRVREISGEMDEVSRRQDELARHQDALEKQQEALGGEQNRESLRVEGELRTLMERAIHGRLAQEVK